MFFTDLIACPLGRLIIEIHDHRLVRSGQQDAALLPDNDVKVKRVVMHPTAESLWTDILLLREEWGHPWTEEIALEVESKLLVKLG